MIIREATRADMRGVHALIQELATYEKQPDAVITTALELEKHGFDEERFECLVIEHEQSIVGMALHYPRYSTWKGPTLHLEDFYIQPQHRGKGWGKLLFEKVLKRAAAMEVGRMEWTVLEWNEPALQFYRKYNADLDPEWHLGTLTYEQLKAFS